MLLTIGLGAGLAGLAWSAQEAPRPREIPNQKPKDEPKKEPKDEPKVPKKGPMDEPKPKEDPKKEPKKDPKDEPKVPPKKGPMDEPKPKDEPKKEPKDEPKKEPKDEPKKEPRSGGSTFNRGGGSAPKKGQLAKYDTVITKDAKSTVGLFAVHRIDDKVFFEIPEERLGKLMLWRAEVAKGPAGAGSGNYNGAALGTKFIRLERRENKIFVIEADFDKRGDKDVLGAVEATGTEPIIAHFEVKAEGKDRSAVIDATNLYMTDLTDLGVRRAGGGAGGSIDAERSYLIDVKTLPANIETRVMLTIRGGGGGGLGLGGGGGGASRSSTAVIHYSLVALPDTPTQGRYFDPRVGYFTESFADYSGKRPWVEEKQFIARFRLEKKDPSAAVSEPVKPIVFYLAPEIPDKWRPYMKKGVEDWAPAFEKAGFKNAIVCKDPPSKGEDPNWDPEDARYSVIRWVAEPVMNAMGPHVHDPRSGEIISAHIIFWHDILKIVHMWYYVQCSAVDPRARKFPFPDDLTGELIRYVCAHEVGHTLGLRHNHRASQAYSIEQLRDPKFVAEHGSVASIMSYGRYNYVAQPEDKIPVKDLIPRIAPYDNFAISWGYKPIADAFSPEAEKPTLDEWAARQIKEPFLRFGGEDGPSAVDPTVLTENISNDPVKATELGFKNMDRVLGYLLETTTTKGEDFELLREAYDQILGHRTRWLAAVLKQVGGVIENRTLGGAGEQFGRVSKEKQKAAVKFLLDYAFTTPKKLLDPAIVNQIKYSGVANDVMNQQRALLSGLLSPSRLNRLFDAEVVTPNEAYTVGELLGDVQTGVWKELTTEAPKIDPLRRNLQRAYVEILKAEFETKESSGGFALPTRTPRGGIALDFGPTRSTELRAAARMALRDLHKQIEAAAQKATDPATKAHLLDMQSEIMEVFESKKK
ncbi:Ferric siderophore transport system, periplasmic binding protein TonB [Fimbriiglobus ruber]|uniref:Ferric siderophore transport system, periplasmic binding protein TonB n=1 Tax=Fimbriiglobus ruber TaxID=1908690 RepID=A0A225DL77_9BACT|nr:Ferric siderophore transport system, periplasmic binding protein TonB [Fimbriiglobus ruber]